MADVGRTPGGRRFGVATAVTVVVAVVISAALAVTTPPRSGPYCSTGCLTRPWTDAASFVPRDYWWMYAMLVLLLAAVALAVTVHGLAADGRAMASHTGVLLGTAATTLLVADYGIQLAVVQPALLAGEGGDLVLWSQYNPHGLFIALEDVGYAVWGLAFVLLGSALAGRRRGVAGAAGWTLLAGGALTLVALVACALAYRSALGYRFEVTALALTWLTLGASAVLVAVDLRRTAPRR
ncbi:hypothetical protein SAMN05216199_1645 [Pedococcus cremeus]|uniref:Uncharacterized protein n=1 Tax=Pedococcus cremeus TaxID=587636 RepID=A0A1H9TJY0_9MICO|nr:hypothetical protein [Pedococcus cremeus]SER97426.1 hypothetical protein SAMN05216199_1645 [Pedococcus cremeus]